MNYLGHLFFSMGDRDEMMGNLIGDIASMDEIDRMSPSLRAGVDLHRRIDYFTDHHPIFVRHRRILYDHFSKYAGVVLDIFYDHLFCLNWDRVSGESFDDFEFRVYADMGLTSFQLPERVSDIVAAMIGGHWLRLYQSEEGMNRVFQRMQKKVSFPVNMEGAMRVLSPFTLDWQDDHVEFVRDMKELLAKDALQRTTPQSETQG